MMLEVNLHLGWDGVTFALGPQMRFDIEEQYPDHLRASRVFLGTDEAYPKDLRCIGGIGDDPDGRLKIIAELLTGAKAKELGPIVFRAGHPWKEIHRVE